MQFNEKLAKRLVVGGFILTLLLIIVFIVHQSIDLRQAIDETKISALGAILSGGVGSLWALAGVVLIYATLQNQKKDSADNKFVSEEIQKTNNLQRFENTFFKLIDLHHNIISSMFIPPSTRGRGCFKTYNDSVEVRSNIDSDIERYETLFHGNQESLSHYFRNLVYILSFIDQSAIIDKQFYANILQAQFSAHELSIIFYYGLTKSGENVKPLLERYGVFNYINMGNVHSNIGTSKLYLPIAYGQSDYKFIENYTPLGLIED